MTEEKPWESSSLIERLKWWAFKFCGKGHHETMASDVMTEAHDRIEKLEAALNKIRETSNTSNLFTHKRNIEVIWEIVNETLEK